MPLADAQAIEVFAGLQSSPAQLARRRLRRAERWVRQRIGDTVYDAAEQSGSGDTYDAIVEAEALYAASRALMVYNLSGDGQHGGFVIIVSVDGNETERLQSAQQLQAYARHLEGEAKESIAHLLNVRSAPWGQAHDRFDDSLPGINLGKNL